MTQLGSDGSDAIESAQAKVSSVAQEASSVVADATNTIAKPTLVANMTAEKACLELLTFSKCQPTAIDKLFLAGFWILVLAAALTTATFFKCRWLKKRGRRVVRWLAVILGSLATMFFLSLTTLCWTFHRLAGSVIEHGGSGENARVVYSCFTGIALLSVVSWGITRQHKLDKTCDKCYGTIRNYSQKSPENSPLRECPIMFVGRPPDAFHPSRHRHQESGPPIPLRSVERKSPQVFLPRTTTDSGSLG